MSKSFPDFSRISDPELALIAKVVAAVQAPAAELGIETLMVGAMARDMHLHYRFGKTINRATEDVDFAFAVASWDQFDQLRTALLASGEFVEIDRAVQHKLNHRSGLPVDLVPFQGVEDPQRQIAWPPQGSFVMDVFGFGEALRDAHEALLPGGVTVKLISLPALALLKIVAWSDRHLREPLKDAQDLALVISDYLGLGNQERFFSDFEAWAQDDDFDYEMAGARLLGHDIRALLDEAGLEKISQILNEQIDPDGSGRLLAEMSPHNPEKGRALLRSLIKGLSA